MEVATLGGAQVLNRPELGAIELGKRGDIAIWDVSGLAAAGAWDAVAALVLNGPFGARDVLVEGRLIVAGGRLVRESSRDIAQRVSVRVKRLMSC